MKCFTFKSLLPFLFLLPVTGYIGLTSYEEVPLFDWDNLWKDILSFLRDCSDNDIKEALCGEGREGLRCRCDEECTEYGDCCFDYAKKLIRFRKSNLIRNSGCGHWKGSSYAYMVNSCPRENEKFPELKLKCEKKANPYTYHMDVPVTSLESGIVYGNVFCAICHEDAQNLESFNASVSCLNHNIVEACGLSVLDDISTNTNYNPGKRSWTLFLSRNHSKNNCTVAEYPITCFLHLELPTSSSRRRLCDDAVVRDCAGMELTNYVGETYCHLYSLPVESDGKIYRNPHCALCNSDKLAGIYPDSKPEVVSQSCPLPGLSSENISVKPEEVDIRSIITPPKPFKVLIGDERCGLRDLNSSKLYFWDDFYDTCYEVTCGYLYQNKGGSCIYKNVTQEMLNKDCFMMTLNSWELKELSNGSILHKRLRTVYNIGEYEIYFLREDESEEPIRQYRVCSHNREKPLFRRNLDRSYLFRISSSVSMISLAIHIGIYTALKKLRDQPAQNILALSCALFLTQFLLLTGINYSESNTICAFIATTLHYFYLVTYFWLNVVCFDICRAFVRKELLTTSASEGKFRFKWYSYYAWGIPLIIVSFGHVTDYVEYLKDYRPNYASGNLCWINTRNGFGLFFVLPIASTLFENFFFFVVAAVSRIQIQGYQ